MSTSPSLSIRYEPGQRRFVADLAEGTAFISYRELDDGRLDLDHTFVPAALRGGGIASRLTARALDYVRAQGRLVVRSCPFVAAYIERHSEYRGLLA